MEIDVQPEIVSSIQAQLQQQYVQQVLSFEAVFADYQALLKANRELQVRHHQLEKESQELRDEGQEMREQLEQLKAATASRSEVIALEQELKGVRAEMSSLYKQQAEYAKEVLEKTQQLQVLREANEYQLHESEELTAKLKEAKELVKQADTRAAEAAAGAVLASEEVARHIADKDVLQAKALRLEKEVSDLTARLKELKDSEVQRLEAVNKHCEEMLSNAKQKEQQAQRLLDTATLQQRGAATAASASSHTAQEPAGREGSSCSTAVGPRDVGNTGHVGPQGAPQGASEGAPSQQRPGPGLPTGLQQFAPLGQQVVGGLRNLFQRQRSVSTGATGVQQKSSDFVEVLGEVPALDTDFGLEGSTGGAASLEALPPPTQADKAVLAHAGGCYAMAFDRYGGRMASCGADRTVKIWETSHAQHTSTLHGMTETVLTVAFTCDGRYVLAGGKDLRLWEVSSGRLRHAMTGHTGKVTGVVCNPTNPHRASSTAADRSIKMWDLAKGWNVHTILPGSTGTCVTATRDGGILVSGHMDGAVRLWDARSGKRARELPALHNGNITSVDCGLSGKLLLTCGKDNCLRVVDLRTFETVTTLRAPNFSVGGIWSQACLSPTEHCAAAGSANGSVFIWGTAPESPAPGSRTSDPGTTGTPSARSGGATSPGGSAAPGGPLQQGPVRGIVSQSDRKHHSQQVVVATAWSPLGFPMVSSDVKGHVVFWGAAQQGSTT